MTRQLPLLDRRTVLTGMAAAGFGAAAPNLGLAQGASFSMTAKADSITLRSGAAPTPVWSLVGADLRLKRGATMDVEFGNDLPAPVALHWIGLDGDAAAEPMLAQVPVPAGGKSKLSFVLRQSGTFLCEAGLLADSRARVIRPFPFVVAEPEPVPVDRDEVILVEDWRLRSDGSAIAPGVEPKDAVRFHTLNGRASLDLVTRPNERLRLRFINGSQRSVLAIKLENQNVRVMAIDSQPAEPFEARNGALVLAPGGRVDAFVDVTGAVGATSAILLHDGKEARPIGRLVISTEPPLRPHPLPPAPPLPSNGLPAQLELNNAQRIELALGAPADWARSASFAPSASPVFRARKGRTVVLALANRAAIATVFHLHGHHFRLLDRLDDGWKPFWLDTLAIEPGQTQRIAFAAEHVGRWLIEQVATDWAAPRLIGWYSVE